DVLKVMLCVANEFVPPLVKSDAVPGTANAPAPVGAVPVNLAFVKPPACCSAWLAIDFAVSTSFDSEVMPVLAACSTCTPLPMLSSRLPMSLARASRPEAVKKLVGLSSALLTFLPVARRVCVVESRFAVSCSESRFWRTDDESVMLERDMNTNLSGVTQQPGLLGRTRGHPESK